MSERVSERLSKSVTECNREGEEARHTVRWGRYA